MSGLRQPTAGFSLPYYGVQEDYAVPTYTPMSPLAGNYAGEAGLRYGGGSPAFGAGLGGSGALSADPNLWDQFSSWFKDSGFLDRTNADGTKASGWGSMALAAGKGLMDGYMGMKQLQFAKDSLEQGKQQFAANYAAKKQTLNSALEDRQKARVASNPGAYESVGDYMNRYGLK